MLVRSGLGFHPSYVPGTVYRVRGLLKKKSSASYLPSPKRVTRPLLLNDQQSYRKSKDGANLDSKRERSDVETIKHQIVAPHQSRKSILNGISQGNATAAL